MTRPPRWLVPAAANARVLAVLLYIAPLLESAEAVMNRPAKKLPVTLHRWKRNMPDTGFLRQPKAAFMLAGALALAGCSGMAGTSGGAGGAAAPTPTRVTGTVSYLQRVALAPTAAIKVQLVDVSRADAPAIVLGEQVIQAGGKQVPFAFEITYDPAKIDPRFSYAVGARIEDGGKLLFINDQRYAVITRGAPTHVEMMLRPVGGATSN